MDVVVGRSSSSPPRPRARSFEYPPKREGTLEPRTAVPRKGDAPRDVPPAWGRHATSHRMYSAPATAACLAAMQPPGSAWAGGRGASATRMAAASAAGDGSAWPAVRRFIAGYASGISLVRSWPFNAVSRADPTCIPAPHPPRLPPARELRGAPRFAGCPSLSPADRSVVIGASVDPVLCPTQVLVGHPFDTIKVRLQTDGADGQPKRFTGVVDAVKQTVRKEGLRGLCE